MKLTLALAIIIATSSAAWAQHYPGGGIGGSYGTLPDGSLDFNQPAPAWQPQSSFKMPSYQLPPPQPQPSMGEWYKSRGIGVNCNKEPWRPGCQ
jgi:hypothetical protein